MLIQLKNISHAYGGPKLLDEAGFIINESARIALLGRNGAGKSTLMKIIHGSILPDSGEVIRQKGITTGYLSQEIPEQHGTVYQITARAFGAVGRTIAEFYAENRQSTPDPVRLAELQQELDKADGWHKISQIDKILTRLELEPDLQYANLSVGLKRRTILAGELVKEPDVLLLDEPTNHLDVPSILWLEEFFAKYNRTLLFVTHDRAFLQAVATSIYELDRGQLRGWECDYTSFLERREADLAAEEEQNRLFDKKLAAEEVWIRTGIKARRTRNEGRVRALKALRVERSQRRESGSGASFSLQSGKTSGRKVIAAENISFAYPDRQIIQHFSTLIMRGDKVGILGANGCGKSTLLKILLKELEPQKGSVEHGTNLEIAYFDQTRLALDETRSILDNIAEGKDSVNFNGQQRHIYSYLQDFLFHKDRLNTPVSALSGGERNRLLLAKLFTRPANLLILDEPTNDLDQETLELLESLLVDFAGTVIIVSHDREFINNVVTSSIIFQPDGSVAEFVGGYENWRQKAIVPAKNLPAPEPVKEENRDNRNRNRERKLSFKEKQELSDLPALIEQLEEEQAALVETMSDAAFYQLAVPQRQKIEGRHTELETLLPEKYARWEELEAVGS